MGEQSIQKLRTFFDDFKRLKPANLKLAESALETKEAEVNPVPQSKPLPKVEVAKVKPTEKPESTKEVVTRPPAPKPFPAPVKSEPTPRPPLPEKPKVEPERVVKINSNIDLSQIHKDERQSLLSSGSSVFDVGIVEETGVAEGSIITDTKRKRHRLLPSLVASIKEWLYGIEEDIVEAQKPKHTVSPAEKRATVIQTAAKQSTLTPPDDYSSVAKRLGAVDRVKHEAKLNIKDEADIPQAHWAYEGDEPAPEPVPTRMNEEPVEPASEVTPEATVAETEGATEAGPPTEAALKEVETSSVSEESTPTESAEDTSLTESEVTAVFEDWEVESETLPEEPEASAAETEAEPEPKYNFRPSPLPSYQPSTLLITGVSVMAVLFGIVTAFWLFGSKNEGVIVVEDTGSNSLIRSDQVETIALSERESFLKAVANINNPADITVVRVVTNVQSEEVTASAADLLQTLAWRAPGGFLRNISDVEIGLYKGTEAFVILKVGTFDTALSGMLAWETSISTDLYPLFGEVVRGTFSPDARTATQTLSPYFVDSVVDNLDVRILRDELHKERITYSFVDQTTILIATDPTSFSSILSRLK